VDIIQKVKRMKIIKFVSLFVGLVSAAASQNYVLSDTIPDVSILQDHQGRNVVTYAEGLVKIPDKDINIQFLSDEPPLIDHLYYLFYNGEDLKFRDNVQRDAFLSVMRAKLGQFENDRVNLYRRTLESQNQLNEARIKNSSILSSISSIFGRPGVVDIEPLEIAYKEKLRRLELLDKKLLKLKAFSDYFTAKLQREMEAESTANSQTFAGKFRNFFGLNDENNATHNILTERSKKN
jgi:hypothetical protein